jgi:hypothetical protein
MKREKVLKKVGIFFGARIKLKSNASFSTSQQLESSKF